MNEPILKRDNQFGDMLFEQLQATNQVAMAANKAGYDKGYADGHLAGMREARAIMEAAFKEWPKKQGE